MTSIDLHGPVPVTEDGCALAPSKPATYLLAILDRHGFEIIFGHSTEDLRDALKRHLFAEANPCVKYHLETQNVYCFYEIEPNSVRRMIVGKKLYYAFAPRCNQ